MVILSTAAVLGLVKLLLDKLSQLTPVLISQYQLRRDVHEEIEKLHHTMSLIVRVIEDAEEKQINDTAVREWLRSLKHVTLEAEDVIDDYATRVALRMRGEDWSGPGNSSSIKSRVWKILTFNNFLPDGDIAHSIRDIRERFEDINKNRSSLGLQIVSSETRRFEITTQRRRPDTTSVLADESSVLGRDKDKQKIIQLLLSSPNEIESSNNQRYVSVHPIVGMGGVGKTTLAQLVFNDKKVKEHFPLRMWVCISDDFDVERVTKEIIESSSKSNQNPDALINLGTMTNLDAIQHRLMKVVEGKLFLLVLDDVWNENDSSKWHSLLEPLKFGRKGSRVIVTTRIQKAADIIPRRMDPIILAALSPDELWRIFQKFAFGDTQMEHMELEVICKKIAERLKGLPLAAKIVGCLLNSNLNVDYWRRILQSDILTLNQGKDGILPALKLSFDHLSPHLKQCFTYCSIFPKDYRFNKDQLVKLWMAQCMIQRESGLEMEDIGSEYFDDLLSRSFFQSHPDDHSYHIMHDLIHDLAEFESKDDCFRMENVVSKDIPKTIRHISLFIDNLQPTKVINLCRYENLRTLLFMRGYKFDFGLVLNELFTKLKRLRVLGLRGCRVEELPDSIGQLQHLRYLDLSLTPLKKLPESLSRLHNLQVLRLQNCRQLHVLPKGITKLVNLRHLVVEDTLISGIEGIGNLTSLQQLKLFDASKHKIMELKGMNQLRELTIDHLEHVEGKEEARQVEMKSKNWLKKLMLRWIGDMIRTKSNSLDDEEVLEGLQPNAGLKELMIWGYAGKSFPSWMMMMGDQSFSLLETISLKNCREVAFLPPMGQLPFLKHLTISGMRGIKHVGHEFYGSSRVMKKSFPSLETLEFWVMSEWEVWKGAEEGQSFFPCLRKLLVVDCPKLMELPPLPLSMTELLMDSLGVTVFPALQKGTSSTTTSQAQLSYSSSLVRLSIRSCPNLKDYITSFTSYGALPLLFPWLQNLESLVISSELLGSLPVTEGVVLPSSLQTLEINNNNNNNIAASFNEGLLLYTCLQNLTSLTTLTIDGCQSLTSFPRAALCHLTSLKYLFISNCQQLTSLELQPLLTSLERLELVYCPKLMMTTSSSSLPSTSSPSSLTILVIDNCANLLATGGLLQSIPSLRSLRIRRCENLQSLPTELGSLSSLERLVIFNCPQIQSLPDIERLPASLRNLHIYRCPTLKERCQRERGPDWHKISHISTIYIDRKSI